eukprot:TRINITY_DN1573_c8_g1_i1.p1 TRINITY_DN1573_c8_g1~~TRINITY_DN1573_c8_g1_i1.p1  ORF type:complete len:251 (-),score=13.71 TRINITY_DN1573_c8_g1_i1:26-778(-)
MTDNTNTNNVSQQKPFSKEDYQYALIASATIAGTIIALFNTVPFTTSLAIIAALYVNAQYERKQRLNARSCQEVQNIDKFPESRVQQLIREINLRQYFFSEKPENTFSKFNQISDFDIRQISFNTQLNKQQKQRIQSKDEDNLFSISLKQSSSSQNTNQQLFSQEKQQKINSREFSEIPVFSPWNLTQHQKFPDFLNFKNNSENNKIEKVKLQNRIKVRRNSQRNLQKNNKKNISILVQKEIARIEKQYQ